MTDSEDRCPHGKEDDVPCFDCYIELEGISEVTDKVLDEFNAAKTVFEITKKFANGEDIDEAELPSTIKIHDNLSFDFKQFRAGIHDQVRQFIQGQKTSERLNQEDLKSKVFDVVVSMMNEQSIVVPDIEQDFIQNTDANTFANLMKTFVHSVKISTCCNYVTVRIVHLSDWEFKEGSPYEHLVHTHIYKITDSSIESEEISENLPGAKLIVRPKNSITLELIIEFSDDKLLVYQS